LGIPLKSAGLMGADEDQKQLALVDAAVKESTVVF